MIIALPFRGVAQPGRALGSGPRGRRFKSYRPDSIPRTYGRRLAAVSFQVHAQRHIRTTASLTQNTAIGNLGFGFSLTTKDFSLKSNVSGGIGSGQSNGSCQDNFAVAGNTNAGSNKSNNVTLSGNPFTADRKN